MASPDSPASLDALRAKVFQQDILDPARFDAHLCAPASFLYQIRITADAKDYGILRFRRWTHGEATRLYQLPFASKIASQTPLTPTEDTQFAAFQLEQIQVAICDTTYWMPLVEADATLRDQLYFLLSYTSGLDIDYMKQLEAFMDTDYGLSFGLLWFQMLGRVPSELASLPETDVRAVSVWLKKLSERKGKGHVP